MAFVRCLQRISSISIIFYHLRIGRDFTGETGNFYAIFFRIPIIQMIGRCSSVLNPDRTWDKNSWRIPFPFFSRKIIRNIMENDENDD